MPCDLKSGAISIASAPRTLQETFLAGLTNDALRALPYLFEFWALPHQLPPEGDWKTWVILGGRGAGKTRAGAEWVRSMVEGARPEDPGIARRVALVGETLDQARDVMVMGESGILACSPPDRRPRWEAMRRRLVWPNGAVAETYSAHDFERLRGPQFDAAWADELAKWPKAEETWDQLQFTLRLGSHPRQVVTTTPRNVPVLKRILGRETTVMTQAPTQANRANLSRSFLAEVEATFGGTRLGRQELDGVLVDDVDGALWPVALIDGARVGAVGTLDRIVVAVDPPVTGHAGSDECGIIVAGVRQEGDPSDWRAVILEDATVTGMSPAGWAKAAVDAAERHGADRIVAEVNQGGDMVESVIRQIDPAAAVAKVRATRGKAVRAEPVAALYERGRVGHLAGLGPLEDQMALMSRTGFQGKGSPDRVDALVWALWDLLIEGARQARRPQVRVLG
ncbi:ATP-binding protein [Alphaproteobacteria bacterium GH1-50]|uniref:ATP-binding protein n=1 Tax=Kangsaoukella pontilimi TaxID=2691042 RepID=A0A7C9IRL3_9RHOB|nr:terminase family protein [Kangsaoukella pontilimi]MXQ07646.1 ATP-binding protein [Kangsaoukella pontilimi]